MVRILPALSGIDPNVSCFLCRDEHLQEAIAQLQDHETILRSY
jgi:hypothetical protein